jgi:hypothetical protein
MTFAPDKVDQFLAHFDEAAPHIRSVSGLSGTLSSGRARRPPPYAPPIASGKRAEALDEYRDSDLFRRTWSTVKPLFAERPRARSYTVARPADAIDAAARDATDPGQP